MEDTVPLFLDMKRLRVAMQPIKCCTSVIVRGGESSRMAWIFSRLALILLCEIIKPKNLSVDTLKAHLVGFNLILCRLRVENISSKLVIC